MKATLALLTGFVVIAAPALGQKVPEFKPLPPEQVQANIAARQASDPAFKQRPVDTPSPATGQVRPHPTKPGVVLVPQWMIEQEHKAEEECQRILAEQTAAQSKPRNVEWPQWLIDQVRKDDIEREKYMAEVYAKYASSAAVVQKSQEILDFEKRMRLTVKLAEVGTVPVVTPAPRNPADRELIYPPEWKALVKKYNEGPDDYTLEMWRQEMYAMLRELYPDRHDLFSELMRQHAAESKILSADLQARVQAYLVFCRRNA